MNTFAAIHAGVGYVGHSGGFYGGHYGGHWHGGAFAPGFALGLGLGALWTYPWGAWDYYPYHGYYNPGYAYVYTPYASAAPSAQATTAPARVEAPQPAPTPEAPPWVPTSPGSGAWVPDPEPYSFTPGQPASAKSTGGRQENQSVSITTSAGGVKVYSNVQARPQ